jgi:hypothetical protein
MPIYESGVWEACGPDPDDPDVASNDTWFVPNNAAWNAIWNSLDSLTAAMNAQEEPEESAFESMTLFQVEFADDSPELHPLDEVD